MTYLSLLLKTDAVVSADTEAVIPAENNREIMKTGQMTVKIIRWTSVLAVSAVLWTGIKTANAVYVKKDLEQQTTLSVMTQVVDRLYRTEGYVAGETPVAFVGSPCRNVIEPYSDLKKITGLWYGDSVNGLDYYEAYFRYVLNIPVNICDEETYRTLYEIEEDIVALPAFPDTSAVMWYKDILIVRMS